jgi:hypothetical protein
MGANIKPENPLARSENLVVEEVAGELLIYDTSTDRAHCLNESAAAIWRHCDGTRSVDKLANHLFPKLEASDATQIVRVGVERLRRRHLIEGALIKDAKVDLSKRQMLKKVAILAAAAGVVAPLISSIVAPSPAYAFSCLKSGVSCESSFQCCTLACLNGACA